MGTVIPAQAGIQNLASANTPCLIETPIAFVG